MLPLYISYRCATKLFSKLNSKPYIPVPLLLVPHTLLASKSSESLCCATPSAYKTPCVLLLGVTLVPHELSGHNSGG